MVKTPRDVLCVVQQVLQKVLWPQDCVRYPGVLEVLLALVVPPAHGECGVRCTVEGGQLDDVLGILCCADDRALPVDL